MAIFRLTIRCDNLAFQSGGENRAGHQWSDEVGRILVGLAEEMDLIMDQTRGPLTDKYGNRVGLWTYTSEPDHA